MHPPKRNGVRTDQDTISHAITMREPHHMLYNERTHFHLRVVQIVFGVSFLPKSINDVRQVKRDTPSFLSMLHGHGSMVARRSGQACGVKFGGEASCPSAFEVQTRMAMQQMWNGTRRSAFQHACVIYLAVQAVVVRASRPCYRPHPCRMSQARGYGICWGRDSPPASAWPQIRRLGDRMHLCMLPSSPHLPLT